MYHGASRSTHRRTPSRAAFIRRRVTVFGVAPAVLALLIFAIVAGTSGSGVPRATSPSTTSHHQTTTATAPTVSERTLTLIDHSNSTFNFATGKTTAGRVLQVNVFYPRGALTARTTSSGSKADRAVEHPLVVFASGFRLRPGDYRYLIDAWARAGFVVAAVNFPNTTYPASEAAFKVGLTYNSPETDIFKEPGDVAFVTKQLLGFSKGGTSWLRGLLDPSAVTLAGHSDGGAAVAALGYDAAYADPGLKVSDVLVLSGGEFAIANQTYHQPTPALPILVVQSATDQCTAPYQAVVLYNGVGAPKYFLLLDQASHLGPYSGSDPQPAATVARVTTAFMEQALVAKRVSSAKLLSDGKTKTSEMTDGTIAAPIATPAGPQQCPHG
jgi:predicted dienelactone hydrolase